MTDVRNYSQEYMQQYRDESFETILVRVRRQRVIESLRRWPHRRILEVGCGLEPLFEFVSDYDAFTVIEPSTEFVARARTLVGARNIGIIEGFLEDQTEVIARTSFDFVIVSSLLHEVPDPHTLLAAIRLVCTPETVVHFNVPNVRSFHRLLAYEMGLISDVFEQSDMEKRFQRHTRFDKALLTSMLASNGFEVIESATYFVKPFTHGQMEALLRSGAVNSSVIAGLERMTKYMPELGCEMYANARVR